MRASDRVYATLLAQIQGGALGPGTVLAEAEQALLLGVSRTPMREAIARLVADGLAVQLSPRVTVVSDIDADDIRALFELRRALEETAARMAATRGERIHFTELAEQFRSTAEIFTSAQGPKALDSYYRLIDQFDSEIDASLGNDYLRSALRSTRTHLVRVRRMAREKPDRLNASVLEHQLIAEAIAAGDVDLAAHATHVHLHNALASILETLDGRAGSAPERTP